MNIPNRMRNLPFGRKGKGKVRWEWRRARDREGRM